MHARVSTPNPLLSVCVCVCVCVCVFSCWLQLVNGRGVAAAA